MSITKISAAMADLDGAVTINSSGADANFIVESDGNANAIFVNAGDDRVTFFNSTTVNAASGTTDGASHYSDGRTDISRASAQPLNIRRRTDDGVAINFYKEASGTVTDVGAIGVQSSDLVIHSNTASHVGLQFGNTRLHPTDNSGSTTDGVADLGFSTTRWKDLYLSGGVVFDAVAGGATSNTLDDYEEGTFTVTLSGTTETLGNNTAYYTKVGRLVYWFWYSASSTFASSSGDAVIMGFPFYQDGLSSNYGTFQYVHGNGVDGNSTGGYMVNNATSARFIDAGGTSGASFIDGSSKYIMASGVYQTDA